jgi:hypothetical protein
MIKGSVFMKNIGDWNIYKHSNTSGTIENNSKDIRIAFTKFEGKTVYGDSYLIPNYIKNEVLSIQ